MLRNRIAELKAIRDQTRADKGRAQEPSITPQALKTFTRQARKRMRIKSGGYAAITCAGSLSASKSMRGKFASWAREAVRTHAYCVVSRHSCPATVQGLAAERVNHRRSTTCRSAPYLPL
jgi:hypothetical protein